MQLCMFVAVTAARCRRCTKTPENRLQTGGRGPQRTLHTHTHRIVPGAEARGTLGSSLCVKDDIKGSRNRSEYYLVPTFGAEKPTETIQNMKVGSQQ